MDGNSADAAGQLGAVRVSGDIAVDGNNDSADLALLLGRALSRPARSPKPYAEP